MHVLFVDHTSLTSGAQYALLDLVAALPPRVGRTLLCPPGPLERKAHAAGCPVELYRGTTASFRLHWYRTPRAALSLLRGALAVRRTAIAVGASVVHANSLRAGIMAVVAARLGGPPAVVQIHDCLPSSVPAKLVKRVLMHASQLVAVSRYAAEGFGDAGRTDVTVVYNPVDVEVFSPDRIELSAARSALDIEPEAMVVGIVAQITPWKGHDVALQAFARVRSSFPSARFLIVGEPKFVSDDVRYDNLAFLHTLERFVAAQRLEDSVRFLGDCGDVQHVFRALDVSLAPSWEEPLGRSILESMAMCTPVIATSVGGPAEVIVDGDNGRLVAPDDVAGWAAAMEQILSSPGLRAEMGRRARDTIVERFRRESYVEQMLRVYRETAGGGAPEVP